VQCPAPWPARKGPCPRPHRRDASVPRGPGGPAPQSRSKPGDLVAGRCKSCSRWRARPANPERPTVPSAVASGWSSTAPSDPRRIRSAGGSSRSCCCRTQPKPARYRRNRPGSRRPRRPEPTAAREPDRSMRVESPHAGCRRPERNRYTRGCPRRFYGRLAMRGPDTARPVVAPYAGGSRQMVRRRMDQVRQHVGRSGAGSRKRAAHHGQHHAAGMVGDGEVLAAVDRQAVHRGKSVAHRRGRQNREVSPTVGVNPDPRLMFSVPPSVAPLVTLS
jgi:hypothetical protein